MERFEWNLSRSQFEPTMHKIIYIDLENEDRFVPKRIPPQGNGCSSSQSN